MGGIIERIAEFSATLPGPGRLAEQRSAALAAFRENGLPGRDNEAWRYTDITGLDSAELEFAPSAESIDPQIDVLPIDGDRIVFVNGHLIETQTQLEGAAAEQVSILGSDWSSLEQGFPLNNDVLEHPLGQLNTATSRHGAVLRTAAGASAERTLNIVMAQTGTSTQALQPRIVLDLGENSSARVVLHCLSDATAAGWMNTVIEVRQAAGSRLELIQLQEQGLEQTQTTLVSGILERDAAASIAAFDLGARLSRNDIDITLAGPGSHCEVFGAFLPLQAQHTDTHVCIDHAAAHTSSDAAFRGIAGKSSRGVFNGKVIVRPDAQKISAEQRSDNLLIAGDAEIDTKPELEIYADDVKCSHGATVGELDEQHMFYLQTRGIDEAAARALLTYAFAQTIVERIADEQLRAAVGARIAQRLPEHERWERLS